MKKTESIKEYSDRLLNIASQVKLLGSSLPESRIVQKILVTILEKFEATITSLENTKDMSKITWSEMLNALQAQERRRVMRQEDDVEGALFVKHKENARTTRKIRAKAIKAQMEILRPITTEVKLGTKRDLILHTNIVVENLIHILNAGEDQTSSATNATKWGMKLLSVKAKINNMVKRHRLLIKRRKINCSWLHVSLALNQVRIGLLTVVVLTI